jgi:hypothetical protein
LLFFFSFPRGQIRRAGRELNDAGPMKVERVDKEGSKREDDVAVVVLLSEMKMVALWRREDIYPLSIVCRYIFN